jgi:hypothetical protein
MDTFLSQPLSQLPKTLRTPALACALMLAGFMPATGQAAIVNYALNFTDSHTHATGSGSFIWNTDTEIMTSLNWSFSGVTGSVLDSALATTYHSYDPIAGTYGELFYRFLTAPQAYLIAEYGLTSASVGEMPYNVSSSYFGFVAFGAEKTSSLGTYRFLDKSYNLATEGYVSAAPVPVPAAIWLFCSALAGFGFIRTRKTA